MFDKLATDLQKGRILNDYIFDFYWDNANGEVIEVKYSGAWLLVDSGYLQCSTMVQPLRNALCMKKQGGQNS